jgi:hypothetical protein
VDLWVPTSTSPPPRDPQISYKHYSHFLGSSDFGVLVDNKFFEWRQPFSYKIKFGDEISGSHGGEYEDY